MYCAHCCALFLCYLGGVGNYRFHLVGQLTSNQSALCTFCTSQGFVLNIYSSPACLFLSSNYDRSFILLVIMETINKQTPKFVIILSAPITHNKIQEVSLSQKKSGSVPLSYQILKESNPPPLHNVHFGYYVYLPTKQAETYLKRCVLINYSTYICLCLFGWKVNMINEETMSSKL